MACARAAVVRMRERVGMRGDPIECLHGVRGGLPRGDVGVGNLGLTPQATPEEGEATVNVPKKDDLAAIFAVIIIGLFIVLFILDAFGKHVGGSRYIVGSLVLVVAGYLFGPKFIGRGGPPPGDSE